MKMYRAILKNGQSVVTVFSEGNGPSLGAAISEQLNRPNNPSRMALYRKWMADGMLVEEVKTGVKIGPIKSKFTLLEARMIYEEYFKRPMPPNMEYSTAVRQVRDTINDPVEWENLIHDVCDHVATLTQDSILVD